MITSTNTNIAFLAPTEPLGMTLLSVNTFCSKFKVDNQKLIYYLLSNLVKFMRESGLDTGFEF